MASKGKQETYEIPMHKCQVCYTRTGRFILDCYCVICEECYKPSTQPTCAYCRKATHNRKLDTKDEETYDKVGAMFGRPDHAFSKGIQILKFHTNIANRYAEYLESELKLYKAAVYDLVRSNPKLDKFFSERIRGFRIPPKYANDGRSKREYVPEKSKKSITPGQREVQRQPDDDGRREHREKEKQRDKSKGRDKNEQDRYRDYREYREQSKPSPEQINQHQQAQQARQPKIQYVKQKHESEDSRSKESNYNWQNRLSKNTYYSREEDEKANHEKRFNEHYQYVHKPKSRSRSSDIPSSSHMGKQSSGPKEFLMHGFRKRA